MNFKMKRMTAALLAMALILGMIPVMAADADVPISRGKTVTASSQETANPVENVVDDTDGTSGKRWAASGGTFPQWLQVDLGAEYNIGYYDILWFISGTRSYYYNIWVSSTPDWTNKDNPGSFVKVVDRSQNTVTGQVSDQATDSYMARYVLIDMLGRSTTSGSASIFDLDVYGWRLTSDTYAVDEPDKTVSGIAFGTKAEDILAGIAVDGNATVSIVDAQGVAVSGNTVVTRAHQIKATCTKGGFSALYALEVGLIGSEDYLVDYSAKTINLAGVTITAAAFADAIAYDEAAYAVAFYDSGKAEVTDTVLAAGMTVTVYAKGDAAKTPLDSYVLISEAVTAVTAVTLDRNTLGLTVNKTTTLVATIDPADATDQRLKWSSSDETVATVGGTGLVTAVGAGTATITVTSYDEQHSDVCLVTVGDRPNITEVQVFYDKMVKPGTAASALGLASTATVTLDDGTTPSYPVVWDASAFDGTIGDHIITGTITLPADDTVTNTGNLKAQCAVYVREGLDAAGSTTTYTRKEIGPVGAGTNVAVIEFDVVIHMNNANSSILLTGAGSTATSTGSYQIHLRTGSSTASEFDAYNDSWNDNIKVPYTAGEVYHIRVESNAASGKFSAWVTAPDGQISQLADEYAFRSKAALTSFGQIALGTSGSTAGRFTVFNIEAYDKVEEQIDSVTLSQSSLDLDAGQTAALTATVLPETATNKTVTWTSSTPGVASVSASGLVTAISQGRTTIRATSAADTNVYAECEVQVHSTGDVIAGDIISVTGGEGYFPLAATSPASIWVDANESDPVLRVVRDLRDDVNRVTGLTPSIDMGTTRPSGPVVIVGTLDGSAAIQALIAEGKITPAEVAAIEGRWEAYLIKVIDDQTLVVVGSDPRGAVFGVYEISEQMGVSPWYYFADVAIQTKLNVYIKADAKIIDMPDVQYRGIFLNDEEKLSRWVTNVLGDPNVMGTKAYAHIFELILRLKGNYLWAAMHVNSINNVEGNRALLQEYGIVLGSSHCDILLRTNVHEWKNWKDAYAAKMGVSADSIDYDYTISKDAVLQYWRENVEYHKDTEAQWTLGMRGPHDEPFDVDNIMDAKYAYLGSDIETRKANIVEEIIAEQQAILRDVLGQEKYDDAFMVMIPYKEVLPIYNHPEFTLPENVTVIWCDDNHSIMRRMPDAVERAREGGHGLYYHVSYWAPADQSYMWLSSAPLALIGAELDKSWEHNVRKAWVLNIGDIKPQEAEMTFFIRYGWDVEQYKNNSDAFFEEWIGNQFGTEVGKEVADIQHEFYQQANVRKVEHMQIGRFNQTYYGDEGAKRMAALQDLFDRAQAIYNALPETQKLGFYELIQCKINWVYYVNKAFYYADKSNLAYDQGRMASADAFLALSLEADAAKKAEIARYGTMNDGKWRDFIDPENAAPPVIPQFPAGSPALVLGDAALGVVVEGEALPQATSTLSFSPYDQNAKFIDVFNKGAGTVNWTATPSQDWVKLTAYSGAVYDEVRLYATVENAGTHKGESATITITDGTDTKVITVTVDDVMLPAGFSGYVEANGFVSIQAEHYSAINNKGSVIWRKIDHLGRAFDGDVMQTYDPALGMIDGGSIATAAPSLEYKVYLTSAGTFPMEIYRVPTLNAKGQVRFAYSVDDGAPIVVSSLAVDEGQGTIWTTHLKEQIEKHVVTLPALTAGEHTIKLWMVDNFISIDKMVIYTGPDGILKTYLGPDESYHTDYNTTFSTGAVLLARTSAEAAPKDLPAAWGIGAFVEQGGKVSIEAEYAMENVLAKKADATADMYAYTAANKEAAASGIPNEWRLTQSPTGMAMRIPDLASQWTEMSDFTTKSPELGYQINFSTTGTYHVWVLWRFVDDASDSIRGGLDGKYQNNFNTGAFFSNNLDEKWYWAKLTNTGINVTTPGLHTLNLWMREDGIHIDRIYLTTGGETPTNASWTPSVRSLPTPVDYGAMLVEYITNLRAGLNFPIGTTPGNYLQADCDAFMAVLDAEVAAAAAIGNSSEYDAAVARISAAEAALNTKLILSDGTATYTAYQDFEGYDTGKLPYGFRINGLVDGSSFTVMQEDGRQFGRIVTSTPGSGSKADFDLLFSESIPMAGNGDEMMIVEFSARYFGGQYSNAFLPRIDNGGNYAMTVAFDNGTNLNAFDIRVRNSGSATSVAKFEYGVWYNFRIIADRVAKTYSVYINGELVAENFNFRVSTGTNMTSWRFGVDQHSNVTVDYDNMRVMLAPLHDVTADTVSGGAIQASSLTLSGTTIAMAKGEQVSILLTPDADYHLVPGSVKVFKTGDPATTVALSGNTFLMPDYPVTITAEFEADAPPAIPVTGVTLNKSATALLIGETETLTATVAPADASDKSVSWSSSAAAVAAVDSSGLITAVGIGTATITVTTTDGGETASCTVTVTTNITAVSALTGVTVAYGTSAAALLAALPATVSVTVSGGAQESLPVVWDTASYDGNTAGGYPLTGTITLPTDGSITNTGNLAASITVTVSEQPPAPALEIVSVEPIAEKRVPYGTKASFLDLPETVTVTLEDASTLTLSVVWDTSPYIRTRFGTYPLTGTLVLVSGILNSSDITASIAVTVRTPAGSEDPVTPEPDSSHILTPEANTNEELGTANVTVSEEEMASALDAAKKNEEDGVIIRPQGAEDASDISVTIPADSAEAVGSEGKSLTVETPVGQIIISGEGLSDLAGDAAQITVRTQAHKSGAIIVTILADGKVVGTVAGGITATIPVANSTDTTVVFLIGTDGSEIVLPKAMVTKDGITMRLDGTSAFRIGDNAKYFKDVPRDSWMAGSVAFVAARELMNGTAHEIFSPDGGMTRAMMATVLHRLELQPEAGTSESFTDVSPDSWYADAVEWAAETGIVTGVGGGLFDGDREISRAELVTMIYRYAKYAGLDTTGRADLSGYSDSADVPSWSAEAFAWAVDAGIISGTDTGMLLPTAGATRAQLAKVLTELVRLLVK